MDYRSTHAIYVRAKQDTEFKPFRVILTGGLTGLGYWFFFPKHQFLEGVPGVALAVLVGAVCVPAIEFMWNYLRAPLRLADERIAELEAQVSQYKATKSEQEINLGGDHVVKGRWYGQRFVFDEPIDDFIATLPFQRKHNPGSITLSCKPNSLGHFRYIVEGYATVCVRTPGTSTGRTIKGSGELEMPLNEDAQLEFESIEGTGRLRWLTLGWTEA